MANTVACSIVSTRLDYCNSLLLGTSAKNIDKLQRVQNTLARVVSGTRNTTTSRPSSGNCTGCLLLSASSTMLQSSPTRCWALSSPSRARYLNSLISEGTGRARQLRSEGKQQLTKSIGLPFNPSDNGPTREPRRGPAEQPAGGSPG